MSKESGEHGDVRGSRTFSSFQEFCDALQNKERELYSATTGVGRCKIRFFGKTIKELKAGPDSGVKTYFELVDDAPGSFVDGFIYKIDPPWRASINFTDGATKRLTSLNLNKENISSYKLEIVPMGGK